MTLFGSSERTKDIVKYVGNLGGESTLCKQKLMKMSRSSLRLRGWIKYRVSRSSKPWIHIRLESFCQLSGLSIRTAKRSLQTLRDENNDLVIRTIHQDRRWKVVASTTERLQGLKRSEPFNISESGGKQIVKESKMGKEIKHEQLIVGKEKVYWNARTGDCLTTDQEVEGSNSENPKQMKLDFSVSVKNGCAYIGGNSNEFKDKRGHQQAGFYAKKQRGLAWALARQMKRTHYDNMKVRHEMRHAFVYALESIKLNVKRQTIVKAYDMAAHEIHAEAVDQGITETGAWAPSSTIHRARRILREGGCYGRWKSSFAGLEQ